MDEVQAHQKDAAVKLFTYLERGEWNKPGRITAAASTEYGIRQERQEDDKYAVYTDTGVLKKLIDNVTSIDHYRIKYIALDPPSYSLARSRGEGGGAWKGEWTEPTKDFDYIKKSVIGPHETNYFGGKRARVPAMTPVSFFLKLLQDSGPHDRPLATVKMLLEAGSIPNKSVLRKFADSEEDYDYMSGYNDEFGNEILVSPSRTSIFGRIIKMIDKYEKAAKKIQTKMRSRMKKTRAKKSTAAKTIQSKTRGHQTRSKQYISKYKKYKSWKGTEARNIIIYDDEDVFTYLRENDRNFVIKSPGQENYEAWNLDDYFKLTKINKRGVHELNKFYECRAASGSMAVENIIKDVSYIKLGSSNFVVKIPDWLSGPYTSEHDELTSSRLLHHHAMHARKSVTIPEPRVFELVKDNKMVNALVSTDILDHGGSTLGGDHCSEGSKPEQIYTLKSLDEGTMQADFLEAIDEYGAKKKKKKKKALTKKKKKKKAKST